jgi:crossover junction endodeoxyribonuclease RusA
VQLNFTIDGDPVPKGRPRHGRGHTWTPKRTLEAEQRIRDIVAPLIDAPFDTPVRVSMSFWCATRRRTDIDNLMKLVLDALNRLAFVDDHLVHHLHGRLHRRALGEAPRTEVRIETFD